MPVLLFLIALSAVIHPNRCTAPPYYPPAVPVPYCPEYGGCRHNFVPAPPGKTPPCAKHGETFCEKIDRYPMLLIRYLIEHWVYDHRTLLSDESKNDFPKQAKSVKPVYGPPPPQHYGLSSPPAYYPPPPHLAGNSINYSQPEGYPERHYPITSLPYYNPGPVYPGLQLPDATPYDPSLWWKRYTRADDNSRAKRQLPGSQSTQLCPTRPEFVSPRAALNSQGNWMYIVNLEQDQNRFTQQIRTETCVSNQCEGMCSLPAGYTSRCQQQYVQKRLVALEGSGNQLYTDTFWLPHCCICQISPPRNG